eukprot:366229-Chlamydomonas_euryale.AAC.45
MASRGGKYGHHRGGGGDMSIAWALRCASAAVGSDEVTVYRQFGGFFLTWALSQSGHLSQVRWGGGCSCDSGDVCSRTPASTRSVERVAKITPLFLGSALGLAWHY